MKNKQENTSTGEVKPEEAKHTDYGYIWSQVNYLESNAGNMNDISWGSEEGILLSGNDAKDLLAAHEERDSLKSQLHQAQEENKRLKNDLLDALDLKQGNGPTALSMLKVENERLQKINEEMADVVEWVADRFKGEYPGSTVGLMTNRAKSIIERNTKAK